MNSPDELQVPIDPIEPIEDSHFASVKDPNWPEYLLQQLQQFYVKEVNCDLTLKCSDKSILAHRIILQACTGYFEELIGKEDNVIKLPDHVSYYSLKLILQFIYTGQIASLSESDFAEVLESAKKLRIVNLVKLLEEQKPKDLFDEIIKSSSSVDLKKHTNNSNSKEDESSEPPKKKINLEEMKALAQAQKVRSSLTDNHDQDSFWSDGDDTPNDEELAGKDEEHTRQKSTVDSPKVPASKPIIRKPEPTRFSFHKREMSSPSKSEAPVPTKKAEESKGSSEEQPQMIKHFTSSDVFYKFKEAASSNTKSISESNVAHTTKLITDLIKKNPQLIQGDKPVKLKVLDKAKDGSTTRVINVTVKITEVDGKKSIQIILGLNRFYGIQYLFRKRIMTGKCIFQIYF